MSPIWSTANKAWRNWIGSPLTWHGCSSYVAKFLKRCIWWNEIILSDHNLYKFFLKYLNCKTRIVRLNPPFLKFTGLCICFLAMWIMWIELYGYLFYWIPWKMHYQIKWIYLFITLSVIQECNFVSHSSFDRPPILLPPMGQSKPNP